MTNFFAINPFTETDKELKAALLSIRSITMTSLNIGMDARIRHELTMRNRASYHSENDVLDSIIACNRRAYEKDYQAYKTAQGVA